MAIKTTIILIGVGCALAAVELQAQQAAVSLAGIVADAAGNPVEGAAVEVRKTPQNQVELVGRLQMGVVRAPDDFDFVATSTTTSSGSFSFSNLPAAAYVACTMFSSGYVNTCEWDRGAAVTIPASGVLRITAIPATVVSIQVSDAAGLLQSAVESITTPHLVIGITTAKGAYHPAALSVSSSTGRTYTLRALPGQAVTVLASSAKFALGGADGTPLPSAVIGTATTAAAGASSQFSITVLGTKAPSTP